MRDLQAGDSAAISPGVITEKIEAAGVRPRSATFPFRLHTFASLRYRDFRYLWLGTVFLTTGMWIQQVTLGWLVYDMTGSAVLLGAIQGARALPTLATAPVAGVIADRVDRRRMMLTAEPLILALTLLLAALIATERVQVWHLFAYTVITGGASPFIHTARHALAPNLVPKDYLMNAIALNAAAFNSTRVLGPVVGGYLIVWLGIAGNFFVQSGAYLAALAMLFLMQVPPTPSHTRTSSMGANLIAGLTYVRYNRVVCALVLIGLLPAAIAFPATSLLPMFARDVLNIGPEGLGLLLTATGMGTLIGPLMTASLGNFRRKGVLMMGALIVLGLALVLFSQSRWLPLSLTFMAVMGASQMVYRTVNNSILFAIAPDEMRGRVSSIMQMDHGLSPFASLVAGILASFLGAPTSIAIMGMLVVALATTVIVRLPYIRGLT